MQENEELVQRLEAAFRIATGRKGSRGARAWGARLAGITARHMSRIVKGEHPSARLEAALAAFEAGQQAGHEASPQGPEEEYDAWLHQALKDGPVPEVTLKQLAEDAGMRWNATNQYFHRSIMEARARLEVRLVEQARDGEVFWALRGCYDTTVWHLKGEGPRGRNNPVGALRG